jgi:hypothetical protein
MLSQVKTISRGMVMLAVLSGLTTPTLYAQDNILKDENVHASFFSETPVENIKANNYGGQGVLNAESGEILFVITIEDFEFKKSLMQKHFNKQYLESDKYPESTFEGKIIDWDGIPSSKTIYNVAGTLSIHGVSRKVSEKASLEPAADGLKGESTFNVLLEDYDIKVPKLVVKKIAQEIEVKIKANFR